MRGCLALIAAATAVATDTAASPSEGFSLGVLGPFTIWSHGIAAGAVAFDLDLRKNFEPELQVRLGAPVIEIPNIHPGLKNVTVQLGTTHGSSSIGLRTAIDWFQGTGGSDQVVGIIGAVFSSISAPVASNGAVFEVPQISYGSTSPALSDKQSYPYFSRVASPDTSRSQAIWAWKVHFQVPSLAVLFQGDNFGTGFYEALRAVAQEAGEIDSIIAVGFDNMATDAFDMDIGRGAWSRVMASGTKFCLLISLLRAQMLAVLEEEGLLYSGVLQIVSPDRSLTQGVLTPSMGYPMGYQMIVASPKGPKFDTFEAFWSRLTPADLYGEEARQRYNLDAMKVPLTNESSLAATRETFTPSYFKSGRWHLPLRLFDAAYSLVMGINSLLLKGSAPGEIRGELLNEEVRTVDFVGVSGRISFDKNGDIRADYTLYNALTDGLDETPMGTVNPSTGVVTLVNSAGIMWAGGAMNVTVPASLLRCDPGQQWNTMLGRCSSCPDGFKSAGGEVPKCEACPVGTTSNAEATGCADCEVGWFNELPGGSCSRCAPGKFSEEAGASSCSDCGVGKFTEQHGATVCEKCGQGFASQSSYTTMTALFVEDHVEFLPVTGAYSTTFCVCGRGTRNSSSGECIPCNEGLLCEGMGSVKVEEGYYAAEDLSVFRCYGDKERCPGGPPGDCCAAGREALGCSECEDGMTPDSNGGCTECANSDKAPFVLALLVIFVFITVAYCIIDNHNRATQSHALLMCTFAISQFVTTIQQMGVIGMMSFEWRDPLKSFMESVSLLIFNLNVLRLGCVGEVKPLLIYLVKVLAIFAVLFVVVLIHVIVVVARHHGHFSNRFPVLVAAFGTVFMVSYISVTSAVMEPWQCLSHPNGKWTVREYPSIICWETGEHTAMLVLGSIMFVTVPLGFIAGTCYIVREFPKRLREADSRAVKAFSFLFFRFRPGCHTYVMAFVLRSFFVALVLVVPDLLVQVFLLLCVLLSGFAVILLWLPWRVLIANVLEAILTCTTLLLIALGVAFIPEEDKEPDTIADVGMVSVLLSLVLVPCVAAYGLWRRFLRNQKPFEFFLCHYKVGSGAWTRLLKFHLIDSRKVQTDVFIDSDNLDHLDHLFNYVGNDTGTLVVVGTQGIFQRPWCLGEMCTAQLKGVKTVLLSLPNFQVPEDSFISELRVKVSNLEMLIESGMSIETLQNTLQWIASVPRIIVPSVVNVPIMDAVAGALCNKVTTAITTIEAPPSKVDNHKNVRSAIICDQSDTEALATSAILQRIVTTFLADEPENIPQVVDHDVSTDGLYMALVICTNVAFTRLNFLELLLKCTNHRLLPIIAESTFQIPGKSFAELLQSNLPKSAENKQQGIALAVASLFKKIGANFEAANASETVLQASAADIAKQIKGWGMIAATSSCGDGQRASNRAFGNGARAEGFEFGDERRIRGTSSPSRTPLNGSTPVRPMQPWGLRTPSPRPSGEPQVEAKLKEPSTQHEDDSATQSTPLHQQLASYQGTFLVDL